MKEREKMISSKDSPTCPVATPLGLFVAELLPST